MSLKRSFYRVLFLLTSDKPTELEYIARKLNVLVSTAKRYLKELLKLGYVIEVDTGKYVLTEKGVLFKKSVLAYLKGNRGSAYYFTRPGSHTPLPLVIRDLTQLYAIIEYGIIDWSILEHHIRSGSLIKWIRDSLGDMELAKKLEEIRRSVNREVLLELLRERLEVIDVARRLKVDKQS